MYSFFRLTFKKWENIEINYHFKDATFYFQRQSGMYIKIHELLTNTWFQ